MIKLSLAIVLMIEKYSIRFKFLSCAFLALSLCGCFSVKPSTSKSGKNLFETFFVGEEGTQYFIKPLFFENKLGGEAQLDFTFRYRDQVKDSCIINISFINDDLMKSADSLIIETDSDSVMLKNFGLLYSQRKGKQHLFRLTSKAILADLAKLFSNEKWSLKLHINGTITEYYAISKTEKSISKLNYQIFSLFN